MHAFDYARPADLRQALAAFRAAEEPRWLAGGQSLIPTMKLGLARPSLLVDLAWLPGLAGLRCEDGRVVAGAMTRHAEAAAGLSDTIPALAALALSIGDPQVRNMGTLGGSLATSDPAADWPAGVLGLNATIVTDRREIAADEFFTGMFETALEPDELITAVSFPLPQRAAYARFDNPASGYALVGVFVARFGDGTVRVAVTGAGPCAFRLPAMEAALAADFRAEALNGITIAADGLNEDMHADARYRAHLVGVMARRAVAAAG